MRGKVVGSEELPGVVGITPACAGKSEMGVISNLITEDHPRVCGEKSMPSRTSSKTTGSPPRVRGKVSAGKILLHDGGITPAHAGKRRPCSPPSGCCGDHPRLRGEKVTGIRSQTINEGLPPPVRGKVAGNLEQGRVVGITPAYAGKRGIACSCRNSRGDHPRVCGEKFHPASDRKLGRVRDTKRSSGPAPAAAPAGPAGSCPASPPWSYPPRITVSRPRP